MDHGRIARTRNSLDAYERDRHLQERNGNQYAARGGGEGFGERGKSRPGRHDEGRTRRYDEEDGYGGSNRRENNDHRSERMRDGDGTIAGAGPPPPPQPPVRERRERSLSPFSKRLALTQAMNMGR